jgi:hypothetical protein
LVARAEREGEGGDEERETAQAGRHDRPYGALAVAISPSLPFHNELHRDDKRDARATRSGPGLGMMVSKRLAGA